MPFDNSTMNVATMPDFIKQKGEWVNYWSATKCTCTLIQIGSNMPDPNRANPNCKACHGTGIVWTQGNQVLGLVTGISQHKDLIDIGVAAAGDMVFSPNLDTTLGDYDKIQFTWVEGEPYEGDVLMRGTGTTDPTVYPIAQVVNCIQVNPNTGNITYYNVGTDFTVNGNVLDWIGTNPPATGSIYSIKYNAFIDWIVFPIPQPRYERGTNLGQRVLLRKKHLTSFGQ